MANVPYDGGVPSESPDTRPPADYQNIQSSPDMFGGAIGQGLSKLGAGVSSFAENYGEVAKDNGANQLRDTQTKLLYGDPKLGPDGKPQLDADGKPVLDGGYFQKFGADALSQRASVTKTFDDTAKVIRENLVKANAGPAALQSWDNHISTARAAFQSNIGQHADQQYKVWAASTNESTLGHAQAGIATGVSTNNPEMVNAAEEEYINTRVKQAQLKAGALTPDMMTQTVADARRDALTFRVEAYAVKDPSRAADYVEQNKTRFGANYGPLVEKFRTAAAQQTGTQIFKEETARTTQPVAAPAGLAPAIVSAANKVGISPHALATAISYETAGTFDPWKAGPTTQWGQHRGLIQWGEPQRAQYGVTKDTPVAAQMDAVARYLVDHGVKPGDGLMQVYAAINAGDASKVNASDANNGGAPGTVADKVNNQMGGHAARAAALLGGGTIYRMPAGTNPGSPAASPGPGPAPAVPDAAATPLAPLVEPPAPANPTAPKPPPPDLDAARTEAIKRVMDDPKIDDLRKGAAVSAIQQQHALASAANAAQTTAEKKKQDALVDAYNKRIMTANLRGDSAGINQIQQDLINDKDLDTTGRKTLWGFANQRLDDPSHTAGYGEAYNDLLKRVADGNPPTKAELTHMMIAPETDGVKGPRQLTETGYSHINTLISGLTPDSAAKVNAEATRQSGALSLAEHLTYTNPMMPMASRKQFDPEGQAAYLKVQNLLLDEIGALKTEPEKRAYFGKIDENVRRIVNSVRPATVKQREQVFGTPATVENVKATLAPPGVEPAYWNAVAQRPPMITTTAGQQAQMQPAVWAKALARLVANPTPEFIAAFNKSEIGRASGGDGAALLEILKTGKRGAKGPPEPVAAAAPKPAPVPTGAPVWDNSAIEAELAGNR